MEEEKGEPVVETREGGGEQKCIYILKLADAHKGAL